MRFFRAAPRLRGHNDPPAMSAEQHAATDDSVPHPRYHETNRKAYENQQAVADAWADGAYPTHNDGELYSSPNFRGEQNADGSGRLLHYRTREAIRTRTGLIITNEQCWSGGFAHCSPPAETDGRLPLAAIERFLDSRDDIYDIARVVDSADTPHESGRHRSRIAVIDPDEARDSYGVAIGYDPSGIGQANRHFAFRVEASDVRSAEEYGVAEIMQLLLMPEAVHKSDLPIVHSGEYAKSYLDDAEAEAHEAAGGQTDDDASWRTDTFNHQHFRADLQGEVIVRHGEWFFIPETESDPREAGTSYAAEQLGSHRARRFHGARSPLPTRCPVCEHDGFGVNEDGSVRCANRDCLAPVDRDVYVRGEISHATGDHNAVNLGETWHRAVTHDRDAFTYDPSPGRHRGGGGWD